MKLDSVLSSVVLPEPVPPEMMMFRRALMAPFEQHHHFRGERLVVQQIFELEGIGAETANGDARAIQGQRRNDGVETRTVRQSRVDHRADFIDASSDVRDDPVDDLQQVGVVAKLDARPFHLAPAFDVDVLRSVDQNIADRMVLEEHLQRSQTKRLVEHLFDQAFPLVAVQERLFRVAQMFDDEADFAAQHVAFQFADFGQVELVDELAVDAAFEFVEFLGPGRVGRAHGGSWGWHLAFRVLVEPSLRFSGLRDGRLCVVRVADVRTDRPPCGGRLVTSVKA